MKFPPNRRAARSAYTYPQGRFALFLPRFLWVRPSLRHRRLPFARSSIGWKVWPQWPVLRLPSKGSRETRHVIARGVAGNSVYHPTRWPHRKDRRASGHSIGERTAIRPRTRRWHLPVKFGVGPAATSTLVSFPRLKRGMGRCPKGSLASSFTPTWNLMLGIRRIGRNGAKVARA